MKKYLLPHTVDHVETYTYSMLAHLLFSSILVLGVITSAKEVMFLPAFVCLFIW